MQHSPVITHRVAFHTPARAPIGVLDVGQLHIDGHSDPEWMHPKNLDEIMELAKHFDLRQIWLTREFVKSMGLPERISRDTPDHAFFTHWNLGSSLTSSKPRHFVVLWEHGNGHTVDVCIPQWETAGPWNDYSIAVELLGNLMEFYEATGTLWKHSGGGTSDAWLLAHHRNKLKQTLYPSIAHDGYMEPDLRFADLIPSNGQYVYSFDGNGAYLGAASSLALPVGQFRHDNQYTPSAPGYFRFGDRWVTTPTKRLHFSNELPDEAYWWPESHQYLTPWYKMIRDARLKLIKYDAANSPQLTAVKEIYKKGIGRFNWNGRNDRTECLFQPYWRHAIQAEARCRIERRIERLAYRPFACDVDNLYFTSPFANPIDAAEAIGLPLGINLGEYKHHGSMFTNEAIEICKEKKVTDRLKRLRERAA